MLRYEHGGDIYGNAGISLDFSVNTNPLGLPEGVKRALCERVEEFERYPDPHCRALTVALAGEHGVLPQQVLAGNGAADLIFRICACLRPKRALVTAPTFSEYERAVTVFGGAVEEYPLAPSNGFALTADFLRAVKPGMDAVFLCTPNNPTGRLVDVALLRAIAAACRENGAMLIVDECFLPFTDGASMAAALEEFPNLLVLRAFTKLYAMAGLRLGYLLAGDAALLSRIAGFGAAWSVSGPAQAAGLAALAQRDWAARTRALVASERAFMQGALAALGAEVFPSDANFLLFRHAAPLYARLRERGILVRDCANFSGLGAGYFRIGLKTHERNQALIRAISEVGDG